MLAMVRLWRGEKQTTRQSARLRFGEQQAVLLEAVQRRAGLERGEIVIENERAGVGRIAHAAGARVARTQVAGGVVIGLCGAASFFHLPLPGALRAVRRNQHPFAGERIEPAMGILRPVEHETL